jgi:hypothetical protein
MIDQLAINNNQEINERKSRTYQKKNHMLILLLIVHILLYSLFP